MNNQSTGRLGRELGLSLAEIARQVGVGISAIGMAIGRMKTEKEK